MNEISPDTRTSIPRGWWLFLALPLIGIAGAISVLLVNTDDPNNTQPTAESGSFPTPKPVTFIPPTALPTAVPSPQVDIVGQQVPDVTLATLDNSQTVKLLDEEANILFLNFWATWCAPCIEEMPMLQDLAVNHAQDGVRVIAVTDPAAGQTLDDIQAFVAEYNLTFTIALSSDEDFYHYFEAHQIPMTFVIDRAGVIQYRHIGPLTAEDIDQYLSALAN